MKIIHTADWHIGQTFFGYDRTAEHQAFLNWLVAQATEFNVEALLISGDVYDVANPSSQAQRLFYHFLKTVSNKNPHLQVIVIAGNHDSAARLEAPTPLLEEMNVHIRGLVPRNENGGPAIDDLILELKDHQGIRQAWCMAIPYLRQGDYPPVETEDNAYQAGVKNMYDAVCSRILEQSLPNEAIIAMGHLQAAGSRLSEDDSSERLIIGGLEGIPANTFNSHITYTALGHIHREQRVAGQNNIHYAGSPLPMSFAEENYHHGVMLLEINNGEITRLEKLGFNPLVRLLRIPSQPRPLPEVLEALARLPEQDTGAPAPYLEVRVQLNGPEPSLRSRIEEAVTGKQVRLTRVVPFYPSVDKGESRTTDALSTEELLNPWKIVQMTYEQKYQTPMPGELTLLFTEALQESYQKLNGKQ